MREEVSIAKEDLRCKQCFSEEVGIGQMECKKPGHGREFIDYKCRFCCNIALYVCFNGTHLCKKCHLMAFKKTLNFHRNQDEIKCSNPHGKCPLGIVDHVQAWRNPFFALGCSLCRSEKLHMIREEVFQVTQARVNSFHETRSKMLPKGEFIPRLMRPDRKEEVKVQKQLAASQVRVEKMENEEAIRMNKTNYLF